MSSYELTLDDIGLVKVTKKRGMKSLRMRISPKGEILVSAPWSVPKPFISRFISDRKDWIAANTKTQPRVFRHGSMYANGKILKIDTGYSRNSAKTLDSGILVRIAGKFDSSDRSQQTYIEKKIIESMYTEAENVLLPRLYELSKLYNHPFNQAYVKRLSGRWGSCDQNKDIILNIFLLQVPTKLQDYVILHELTHTKHLNHSSDFWDHMSELMPSHKLYRKMLKNYSPAILIHN